MNKRLQAQQIKLKLLQEQLLAKEQESVMLSKVGCCVPRSRLCRRSKELVSSVVLQGWAASSSASQAASIGRVAASMI